jgi:hypothetical protein
MDDTDRVPSRAPVLIGLLLIAAGVVLLADRIGVTGIHLSGRHWPIVFIAFGLARLIAPRPLRDGRPRSRRAGAWFGFLGSWFFLNELHLSPFDYGTSWPQPILAAGVLMVWRAVEHPAGGWHRVRES